ncbi:MAG TPA: undecaprenyldiphospho-muramoylpentapeptide beta-N-acetylglucosaminyltransferase [Flavobacteriaceae bacterium]|nr:undecaprenyldiphospho-muramoylpentapeptide beta-N-acetylglucosaminyltransferase [Flavobacteriaceae bacterium]
MKPYKVIISGGGTGGHIYPAIAIADELKSRNEQTDILFVGAEDRMEMQKVPEAGYPIKGLWIAGLQRKLSIDNLMLPFKLLKSFSDCKRILKEFKPDVVIGTGGYASAPLVRVASKRGIPCVIQEQNSYAGITNKLLSKRADKICVAFDGMEKFFPESKLIHTGNPVRKDIISINTNQTKAKESFGLKSDKKTLLILGGSLGAKKINELVKDNLDLFEELGLQVLWQCGAYYIDTYKGLENDEVKVTAYISNMAIAYAAADVIISRAGALAIAELCLVGKPSVFIPSPNVAEDHQTKNAQAIVNHDAAMLVKEQEIDSTFVSRFTRLMQSDEKQKLFSNNIKKLAKPNATEEIVDVVEKLISA